MKELLWFVDVPPAAALVSTLTLGLFRRLPRGSEVEEVIEN
jgi:hypothetical protein